MGLLQSVSGNQGLGRVRGRDIKSHDQHTCVPDVGKSRGCAVSVGLQLHFWLKFWVALLSLESGKNTSD